MVFVVLYMLNCMYNYVFLFFFSFFVYGFCVVFEATIVLRGLRSFLCHHGGKCIVKDIK